MYKLSVPISMNTMNDKSIFEYIELAQKCKADRIFICGQKNFYEKDSEVFTKHEVLKKNISIFRENGFEVGVWVTGFGHGAPLSHQTDATESPYTQIEGINGEVGRYANCPLDQNFVEAYAEGIKRIAELKPDIIMIDDDFRMNGRQGYYFGCFCPRHMKEYYKRLGEKPPREQLESLMFTGGKNKYRSAYFELSGEVLLNFAKTMRAAVDSVDPTIRLGSCGTNENWDFCGTDMIELAKAFAGDTAPFARICGAPYWRENIIHVIEASRQQFAWAKDTGVELFAEGDTYPRPRYNVPSKLLELFDLTLYADGTSDGQLAYVFDYTYRPEYEVGYVDRYVRNEPIRNATKEIFEGKKAVGVEVFNSYHKVENFVLSKKIDKIANKLVHAVVPPSRTLICGNSIPTAFEECGYPVLVIGENARYIEREKLKNGAILDTTAAEILKARGVDVGLVSAVKKNYSQEYFVASDETVIGISTYGQNAIECDSRAIVHSRYLPDNVTASYTYENGEGERFYVLGYDHFLSAENINYMNNYHRQSDLVHAIEWLCGKKLPAVAFKHPRLYILASKNEEGMAVSLSNVFLDDIYDCEIQLDKEYSEIKFVNCSGKLVNDKVYISWIPPYGFAAFEVK